MSGIYGVVELFEQVGNFSYEGNCELAVQDRCNISQ